MAHVLDQCLADCTPAQRQAITHPGGPLLVVAGAGSGKTRVITRRIAWLIAQEVRPTDILAITFTNKAADEMRERVLALGGARAVEGGLWVGTFHSLCARMLRHHAARIGHTPRYSIYDASDAAALIRKVLRELDIAHEDRQPASIAAAISRLKNRLVSPEAFQAQALTPYERDAARVYARYQQALKANNAMDFDDLLGKVIELFEQAPDVRARYAERYRHILIDEYQDTNRAQYIIARALAERHRNLCVTGDPDQSIYGWRGADISNILDFERDYPDATVVILDRNFRSTQTILDAANGLIAHNVQRKPKDLHTDAGHGAPVRVCLSADETEEARHVASEIVARAEQGASYDDFAVFYRTNAQSRALEAALREAGAPYRVVAGVAFFDRREVKDVLAYLRVCANPADDESLERILNVPPRGLGDTSRERLRAAARARGLPLCAMLARGSEAGLSARQAAKGAELARLLDAVRALEGAPILRQIQTVLTGAKYREHLRESAPDWQDRDQNVAELLNLAGQYDAESAAPSLAEFLERAALSSDQDALDRARGAVKLMTLHTAKGLEFPVVYVVGLEEGLLPLEGDEREIEEERRLFFVGLTRAKREVTLTRAACRRRYGLLKYPEPSRFLREMPPEALEVSGGTPVARQPFGEARRLAEDGAADDGVVARDQGGLTLREGDRVRHRTFGSGRVISLSGTGDRARAVVRFPGVGEKVLILKYSGLEKSVR